MDSYFTTTSGSSIYVEDTGTGPVVLAVHGLGGGAYFFRGFATRLASAYRVISVDLPGTGRSIGGPPFSAASWARDLGDLVEQAIGEPVAIVGHSLGTIIALESWHAWPRWIRALVFVGGLPTARPLIRERIGQRIATVTKRPILTGLGRSVVPGVFSPATLDAQPELSGLFERLFESQDPMTYVRAAQALLDGNATTIVPTVTVPCLAITGADDQYAPPDNVRAFVSALPAPARVEVIPDCGHVPFLEVPDRFAAIVGEFLKTI